MPLGLYDKILTYNSGGDLKVAANATVTVYKAGTSTKVSIYSDSEGTTPKDNPFTATSDGRATFYCAAQSVKIVFSGAGFTETTITDADIYRDPADPLANGVVDVTSAAYGATGDGTTDDTAAIQAAMEAAAGLGMWCIIPRPAEAPYTYRVGQLEPPTGTRLFIAPGTVLQAVTGLTTSDHLLYIAEDDVTIIGYGATLTMGDGAVGTGGSPLRVQGAARVRVEGLTCQYSATAGVEITGAATPTGHAEQVVLQDVAAQDNAQNGFVLFSGRNVVFDDCRALRNLDTDGYPGSGFHIEPWTSGMRVQNIVYRNCYTEANAGYGWKIGLQHLTDAADPYGVDVRIEGGRSYTDVGGVAVTQVDCTTNRLPGHIVVDGVMVDTPTAPGFAIGSKDYRGPHVYLRNCTVRNANAGGSTGDSLAAVFIGSSSAAWGGTFGGVTIDGLTIIEDRATPLLYRGVYVRDAANADAQMYDVNLRGLRILGTLAAYPGFSDPLPCSWYNCTGEIEDPYGTLVSALPDAADSGFGSQDQGLWHNGNFTAARTCTLADAGPGNPTIWFEVRAAQMLTLTCATGDSIAGWCGAGGSIRSNEIGARVGLKKRDANTWYVVEMHGTWERVPIALDNADQVLTAVNYDREFTNLAYTGQHALTLPASVSGEGDITVKCDVAQNVVVTCAGSDKIYPGTAATLTGGAIGNRLRLRPQGSNKWYIMEQVGTWS